MNKIKRPVYEEFCLILKIPIHSCFFSMRIFLYCFCLIFIILSCQEKKEEQPSAEKTGQQSQQSISKNDIKSIEYIEYGLGTEAKNAVANWLQYKELNENIERLKDADMSFLQQGQDIMVTSLNDLRTNIPAKVNTKSIKARLLALETQLLMANSLLNLKNVEKEKKLAAIKQVFIAMSNFNDQMNKKFEIEGNNILSPQ